MEKNVYFVIGVRFHSLGTSTKVSGVFDSKKGAYECAKYELRTHGKEWTFEVYKTELNKIINERPK